MAVISHDYIHTYRTTNKLVSSTNLPDEFEWEQFNSSIVELIEKLIDIVENIIFFKNDNQIRTYLKDNIFLLEIILNSYIELSRIFHNSIFVLEYSFDPEIQPGNEQLVLYIVTDFTPETAYSKLKEFDNTFWLDNISKTEGKLCINLEFR